MRYLLLIANEETKEAEASPEQMSSRGQAWGRFTSELQAAGKMLGGERLRPATTATTVRQPNGRTLLSDGPFIESKEQLGGYYLIEAADLDAAIAIAKRVPMAEGGVEVRPIRVFSGR